MKYTHELIKLKMFFVLPFLLGVALWHLTNHEFWWLILILALLVYYPVHFFGSAIGHHKLFQHKAFKAKTWYPFLATFFASIAFWGDPLGASMVHRIHHKYVDGPLDPHSPCHGRWHSFLGWMWSYRPPAREIYIIADLIRDYPWMVKYRRWEFLVPLIFHCGLYLINLELFLVVVLACLLSIFNGLFVNAFSHDPTLPGNKSLNRMFLARLINSVFIHRLHHDQPGLWDNSHNDVRDWSALIIKYFLAADQNNVKGL